MRLSPIEVVLHCCCLPLLAIFGDLEQFRFGPIEDLSGWWGKSETKAKLSRTLSLCLTELGNIYFPGHTNAINCSELILTASKLKLYEIGWATPASIVNCDSSSIPHNVCLLVRPSVDEVNGVDKIDGIVDNISNINDDIDKVDNVDDVDKIDDNGDVEDVAILTMLTML